MATTSLNAQQRLLLDRLLAQRNAAPPPVAPLVPAELDRTRAPLSLTQRRIWFFDHLQPGSPLYVIVGTARLRGDLDVRVLGRCLSEMVRRHESLRTTFHFHGYEPWCRVQPPREVELPVYDLSGLADGERAEAVTDWHRTEARRPFDLSRDLLLRAVLLRTGATEHLLVLSLHHIAADGWSLGVLMRELGALYTGFGRDEPAPLPPPALQYLDFTAWQRRLLAGPLLAEQLNYWRARLTGAPLLDLPTDRPRQTLSSFAGSTVPLRLPAELVTAIKRLADGERATPYVVLLTGFALTLGRWSGQSDVVVGVPVANRNRAELENLIGFFVNTLAIRLDLSGRPTLRTLLRRTREACLGGYAHQDVPFDRVIEELAPDREANAHTPLVRHMLVLHNTPRPRLRLPGLSIDVLPLDTGTAKFDVQVELTPEPDGALTGFAEYATELFDAGTVERLLASWQVLLADAVRQPDAPVDTLALLDAAATETVNRFCAGGPPAVLPGTDLNALLEPAATAHAEAVAVTAGATQLTYRELHARANRLAHHLRRHGTGPDVVVGVHLPRGLDALVTMLAVVKSGAAYLPLDPAHPPQRTAGLLADARAALVVGRGDPQPWPVPSVCLDTDADQIMSAPADPPAAAAPGRDRLAYVLYTSGSTGTPKGAGIGQYAVANRIGWMRRAYPLGPGDAVLHKTPLGFDVSGWEWLWPLSVGARTVIAEGDGHRDPGYLAALVHDERVDTCHFVPSMLRAFLAEPAAARCAGILRQVVCSGEELTPGLVERLREVLPSTAVHNLYGPTEAAIDVSAWTVPAAGLAAGATRVPIGRPIDGTRLYVLDERLRPVPVGVPGELFIGGVAVGRGYVGRPGLTAHCFLPDPYGPAGGRMYRTGDRVRWLAGGELEFLGRLDQQVKVNGQRIEPAEVEAALATHPGVDRALVLGYRDAAGNSQLAAYVTLRENAPALLAATSPGEQVNRWRSVFEDTYVSPAEDPAFDIAGWVSSYTGQPIPAEEMRDWVAETVERVRSLRPRRVLEIGCGTGLLLRRLAPDCASYCGTDLSTTALARIEADRDGLGELTLLHRAADDFTGWAAGSFDTIVLNSVVQYFPDLDYLRRVLDGALRLLTPDGHLFVGDVRSMPLLAALTCATLTHRLPAQTSLETLRRLTEQQVAAEEELVLHPDVFAGVAARTGAGLSLLAKGSRMRNELTRFRYDVVLAKTPPAGAPPVTWLDWASLGPTGLAERLAAGLAGALGVRGVSDERVGAELHALALLGATAPDAPRTVGDLRQAATVPPGASEPAVLAELAARHDRRLIPLLGAEPGRFDAVLTPPGSPPGPPPATVPAVPPPGVPLATEPTRAALARLAVPLLRTHLRQRLPDYMVPASVLVLPRWPVGPTGKLDRAALPPPDALRPALAAPYVPPRSETERAVAQIWSEVLGVNRIGVHDDFFGLGGHSLLATQVVARIRAGFGRDLPLRQLFRTPTVAAIAAGLDGGPGDGDRRSPAGPPPPAAGAIPRANRRRLTTTKERP